MPLMAMVHGSTSTCSRPIGPQDGQRHRRVRPVPGRFMVGAVRGKLQFGEADGGTELGARVVRWPWVGRKLISFHRRLGRYEGMTGNLTLDDGTVVPVNVKGPFLRVIETPQGT